MSDFEASPPKEIEIDADGEGGEALLKKSPSPDPEPAKTNGKSSNSETRHRSRSRSRSRSRHRHHRSRRRYSRSRSRSPRYRHKHSKNSRSRSRGQRDYDYDRDDRYDRCDRYDRHDKYRSFHRDNSRSPMSTRKRHLGDRENPPPSRCIGVFGLSLYTQERGLREVFGRYGQIDEVQVVYDRQTGRSRGFAFVYFKSADDAFEAKDRCNGIEIDGRRIRVDFSVTERAHTPTPGIYLGKPSDSPPGRSPGRRYSSSFRRSPSPYGSYGYHRGRSFTPPR